jgi:predicted permease
MSGLWHDFRFAVRALRKNPASTLLALLALALGIGVNTSVFCVLHVALWQPLAAAHPERIVAVLGGAEPTASSSDNPVSAGATLSYPDYADLRDRNESFSGMATSEVSSFSLSTSDNRRGGANERAEPASAEIVSGNYFDVLGVRAALGRTFAPDEYRTLGSHPVMVISDSLWRRRFHSDPQVVGRALFVNRTAMTIIGVAPASFTGTTSPLLPDFWFPSMMRTPLLNDDNTWLHDRTTRPCRVFARLLPGVALEQARANIKVIWQSLAQQYPATNKGSTVDVVPEVQARYGSGYESVRLASLLAQLVAGLVLLISCANVANLLLARAAGRAKEIAIRRALGASRRRVVQQLLTECVALALAGGALGLVVAAWCGELFRATLPPMMFQVVYNFAPDRRAFAGALAISLLSGVLFGLAPALRTSRVGLSLALKTDVAAQGQGLRHFGLRQLLVVAQVAVSIVVVVSGALFLRSLRKIEQVDPGVRIEGLYSVMLDPGQLDYSDAESKQYFKTLVHAVENLPGVQSVSIATFPPLNGVLEVSTIGPIVKEGDPPPPPNQGTLALYAAIGPKYFETVGTELLLGRDFFLAEHEGTPRSAIVNRELARTLYGDAPSALGKRFRFGGPDSPLFEIVGVAVDGKYVTLTEEPRPFVYVPEIPPESGDAFRTGRALLVHARARQDLASVAAQVQGEIQRLDARIPMGGPAAEGEHLAFALYLPRVAAMVGVVLSLVALFLAVTGVYGVMAYGVSQRTKEIGIRRALGAPAGSVVTLVVRQGIALVGLGIAIGSVGAFFAGRMAARFLFGIGAADPLAFGGALLLLLAVAFVATYLPARRAARVDPMIALRYE